MKSVDKIGRKQGFGCVTVMRYTSMPHTATFVNESDPMRDLRKEETSGVAELAITLHFIGSSCVILTLWISCVSTSLCAVAIFA